MVLLTGATGRLGPLVAREIVRRGTRLVLVARSESRLAQVGGAIRERSPGADADTCVADFSQLSSVGRAGAGLAASCSRLDAMIHLAERRGGVVGDGPATPEAITVNYLAPWLLTDALLPLLLASSGRVITPGADPARPLPPVVLPEALFGVQVTRVRTTHYGLSRVLGTMFSLELGRCHQDSGLSSIPVVAPPDTGWLGAVLGMMDPRRWV